jgi:flavin reductase (DIM6/NTAB) family NADH-FMN oxidoreductase RutF
VLCGTYGPDGRPNLATLAWTGLCCSEPPCIQISIRKSRHTHAAILARKEFTVNIPSASLAKEVDFCGITSGRDVDKFERTGLTPMRSEFVDAPLVDEFPLCLECRLRQTVELGSHDMFIGEIIASWFREDCLNNACEPDPLKISPLAFTPLKSGSAYYSLGDTTGRAFSVGKTLLGH